MTRPRSVSVDCPAKVNFYLEVLGRRPDGYHDLQTVMAPISLADSLRIETARGDVLEVTPEGSAPTSRDNTVLRTLAALRKIRKVPQVRIRLTKRCPSQAGLGGGSSDAAGLLKAADRRFDLGLTIHEHEQVLASIGSDTVFFARGVPALCTGRGERVFPIRPARSIPLVLYWPRESHPTADIFSRLTSSLTPPPRSVIDFLNILSAGDAERIGASLFNRLETAAEAYRPGLAVELNRMRSLPFLGVGMTGSGSCIFGVCGSRKERADLARRVSKSLPGAVYLVETAGS